MSKPDVKAAAEHLGRCLSDYIVVSVKGGMPVGAWLEAFKEPLVCTFVVGSDGGPPSVEVK